MVISDLTWTASRLTLLPRLTKVLRRNRSRNQFAISFCDEILQRKDWRDSLCLSEATLFICHLVGSFPFLSFAGKAFVTISLTSFCRNIQERLSISKTLLSIEHEEYLFSFAMICHLLMSKKRNRYLQIHSSQSSSSPSSSSSSPSIAGRREAMAL